MIILYKYRIYPTKSQSKKLNLTFEICSDIYNMYLKERIDYYKETGLPVQYNDQQNSLPKLKESLPVLKEINSKVLQDVLRRLDKSFKNFFRKKRVSEHGGFPKFKKIGQWKSITDPQYRTMPSNGMIRFSKIGMIKAKIHREIPANAGIKTLTILKDADKWFAVFSLDFGDMREKKKILRNPLGIDMGLKHFMYPSSGYPVGSPKYFRKSEKIIKKLQAKLAKSEKRTNEYKKILSSLRKANYRVRCKRDDFLHKTSNSLLLKSDLIFYEDLDIKKILKSKFRTEKTDIDHRDSYESKIRSNINKSISDASWGKFINMLKYKSEKLGKVVIPVDPSMTTEMCSSCGDVKQKSISDRKHSCAVCGFTSDRDKNAAINILRLGLESFGFSINDTKINSAILQADAY